MSNIDMEKEAKAWEKRKRQTLDEILNKAKKRHKKQKGSDDDDEENDLFIWEDYLKKCRAKSVPKSAFKHVKENPTSGFRRGMKVEAKDYKSNSGTYWVATIIMVSGPLLLLRFDGYGNDRSEDFWCDASTPDVQPIGWCAKTNTILIPPQALRQQNTNWAQFLMDNLKDAVAAPESLFKQQEAGESSGVPIGTMLELQDYDDPLCYWVASVVERFGLRLKLRYAGAESEEHDVWVYYLSDNVHKLGWGKRYGLTLQAPKGLTNRVDMSAIIDDLNRLSTTSNNGSTSLKKKDQLPPIHGFKSGMKLEAVNPTDPSSICVATVSRVVNEHYFVVTIDDFVVPEARKISFWCHAKSRNIFPCRWCEKNKVSVVRPAGYQTKPFHWDAYLVSSRQEPALASLFDQTVPNHGFEAGYKLEAVNQIERDVISAATVKQIMGRTMWIQLDAYTSDVVEHIYDVESCDLFPVGWCGMQGHPLLTPQAKKKENLQMTRLRSLRATKRRLAKATPPVQSTQPVPDTPSPTSRSPLSDSHKNSPVNTLLKTEAPEVPTSTAAVSTPSPSPNVGQSANSTSGPSRVKVADTIDLTDDHSGENEAETDGKICLYVKSTCSCGPYLDKKKLAKLPPVIGPESANLALRKLVEHIVVSSHSSKKVLKMLAAEKEKKTFASILKTLTTKLLVCQNVFSLSKVALCKRCDISPSGLIPIAPKAPQNTLVIITSQNLSAQPNLLVRPQIPIANQTPMTPQNPSMQPISSPRTIAASTPNVNTHKGVGRPRTVLPVTEIASTTPTVTPAVDDADQEDLVVGKLPGRKHVSSWTVGEVVSFIESRDCRKFADVFREQEVDGKALMLLSLEEIHKEVDGKALMLLSLEEIHKVLGVTLGPALKLQDDVQILRKRLKS